MADAVEWWWRWQAVAMAVEAVVPVVVAVKWRSSGDGWWRWLVAVAGGVI